VRRKESSTWSPGHSIELERAAAGQVREAALEGVAQARSRQAGQGREDRVVPVLLAVLADEVEHQARGLAREQAQAAAELLLEQGRAGGRAEEQQHVDERQVDALVVQVAREDQVHLAVAEPAPHVVAQRRGAAAMDRHRRHAERGGLRGHVLGVLDAHAEAQPPHRAQVGDAARELRHHEARPRLVAGVEPGQRRGVVASASPAHAPQVGAVGQAVVLERREELLRQRVGQAQLGGDAIVEVRQQRLPVAALGGGGEAEQQLRAQRPQDRLVRGRGQVMALIDHHVSEVLGAELVEQAPRALDGREHVVAARDRRAAGDQLAEPAIEQDLAERVARLLDDLHPVRQVQEPRRRRGRLTRVVERGDDGLARTGGGDHEVARVAALDALGAQAVEDDLLIRVRLWRQAARRGPRRGVALERAGQLVSVGRVPRIVALEFRILPEGLEGAGEVVDHVRQVAAGHLHHPLVAGAERRRGEVGRTDVRRGQAVGAVEQPRLRV
jgi:hypothetical protein